MAEAPAFDASLTQHGLEATSAKGLTYPLGSYAPGFGDVFPLLDGIGWTRLPVPGSLRHINVWLLDDVGGTAIVDTGIASDETKDAWTRALNGRTVSRVLATHFHPDHIGCAGWLCETHGVRLWMNRTEYLLARMLTADQRDAPPAAAVAQWVMAGWSNDQVAAASARGWGSFAKIVSPLPIGHVRIVEGARISIGKRDWSVWIGSGHTPEHVCFVDMDGGVMIAGDQVLPRISSNVSLSITEPLGDPLGDWLASIEKFRALPGDMLVLPAHGEPFKGLHARLDRLEEGHRVGLDRLVERLRERPQRAVDIFGALFGREISANLLGLATGEALAHLRHLEVTGRAICDVKDGVGWWSAA